jgi:hypothetical protein
MQGIVSTNALFDGMNEAIAILENQSLKSIELNQHTEIEVKLTV